MSYHVYTTEGIILSESPYKEADKTFKILTRDLGLVRATATGVRKEVSKLRAGLQPLTLSRVSLVRGKEYWRLTSAHQITNFSTEFRTEKDVLKSLSRVFGLIEKLIQGEEKHPEIFDDIEMMTQFVLENQLSKESVAMWELIFVSKMLYRLGYLSKESTGAFVKQDITLDELLRVSEDKKRIFETVNKSLRATGLS